MAAVKRVRIIKKVREGSGVWRFVSVEKKAKGFVWDDRPGYYFLEWWEGRKRRRQLAGETPSEAMESHRRKRHELVGQSILEKSKTAPEPQAPVSAESPVALAGAIDVFLQHVRVHSPDKPRTARRYKTVLDHVARIMGSGRAVDSIKRPDIDDYKLMRSREGSKQHNNRPITARTINYEIAVLRTFFYFLIRERNVATENPCANFKLLKDPRTKAKRRPPTYKQAEIDRLLAECDEFERTVLGTFLLTGMREEELCFLTWDDIDLQDSETATICVSGEGKEGFSPKDYEERRIPIPEELAEMLRGLPRESRWVFPTKKGNRQTHLLRKLKEIAAAAEVEGATLHKFRHTYATRLLESGCDIVTVQRLMGHSDLDTTRQYLDPDEELKRKAVGKLSLKPKS